MLGSMFGKSDTALYTFHFFSTSSMKTLWDHTYRVDFSVHCSLIQHPACPAPELKSGLEIWGFDTLYFILFLHSAGNAGEEWLVTFARENSD